MSDRDRAKIYGFIPTGLDKVRVVPALKLAVLSIGLSGLIGSPCCLSGQPSSPRDVKWIIPRF
jgi:hypothetical protein